MTRRLKSIRNKYFCNNCCDQNWIIECECGCGKSIGRYGKNFLIKKFSKGHNKKFADFSYMKKGINNHNWKFGRYKKSNGYWILSSMYGYTNADKRGRIREHIYFFQEYYQCSLLPWGVVHHIIPVSKDYCNNMIWNLMGMTKGKHFQLHRTINRNKLCYDIRCENK